MTKQPKPFNYKAVNAVVPFRIKNNKVIQSTPVVNNALIIRRWFRVTDGQGPTTLTVNLLRANALASIGISAIGGASVTYSVHGGRVFTNENANEVQNVMDVGVYDIEETGIPAVAKFSAASTNAGYAHVQWVHPVNNRPTVSQGTTGTSEFIRTFRIGTLARCVIDVDMTICINPL